MNFMKALGMIAMDWWEVGVGLMAYRPNNDGRRPDGSGKVVLCS